MGEFQIFLRSIEAQCGNRKIQSSVSLVKKLTGNRKLLSYVSAHARVLSSLAWKYECDFHSGEERGDTQEAKILRRLYSAAERR